MINAADESPVAGAAIAFTTSSDSGFFVADRTLSTVTDATGRAGLRYLLGRSPTAPATQILTARVQDDPSVPSVSHAVTAHLPELSAKTRIYRLPYVLQDTAEWAIETAVTYDGERYPLPQTPVELTFEHDGTIVAPAETLLLLGPEFSRQTAADGVVWTTVVPRQPGTWKATARLPEFPELAAVPISVYLSGVPVADSIGVLLRGDSSGLGLPSYLSGTILRTPAAPGTAASGRVAAPGHPLTFEVDPLPVPPIFNTWFTATYGSPLSSWKVRLRSVGADPVTLSSAELTIPSPDGKATFTAEPTGNRTSLIEVELWGLDATGRYERLMWTERAGMFAPEVTYVKEQSDGSFKPLWHVPILPPEEVSSSDPYRFFIELRTPLDEMIAPTLKLESTGICRDTLERIEMSAGKSAPTRQELSVGPVVYSDTNRFRLRRVHTLLSDRIEANIPTPTPASITVVQFADPRGTLTAEVLGSKGGVQSGGILVSGLPSYSVVNGKKVTVEARFGRSIGTEIPSLSGTRTLPDGSTEEIGIPVEPERIGAVARWVTELPQGQIRLRTAIAGEALESNVLLVPTENRFPTALDSPLGPPSAASSAEVEIAGATQGGFEIDFQGVAPGLERSVNVVGIIPKPTASVDGSYRAFRSYPLQPIATVFSGTVVQAVPGSGVSITDALLDAVGLHPDVIMSYLPQVELQAQGERGETRVFVPYITPAVAARIQAGDPSDAPFTGSGATGSYTLRTTIPPAVKDMAVPDPYQLATFGLDITLHRPKYTNAVTGKGENGVIKFGTAAYLETLSTAERIAQAKTLLQTPNILQFGTERSPYSFKDRKFVIMVASLAFRLEEKLIGGILLAEQRDQSENEDIADLLGMFNGADTSIGLGQVVVSTVRKHDLFRELLPGMDLSKTGNVQLGMLLALDDFNIWASAKYARKVADLGTAADAVYPEFALGSLAGTSDAWGSPSGIDVGPLHNAIRDRHPPPSPELTREGLILLLGSEYSSLPWDRGNTDYYLGIERFWGLFVVEAQRDMGAALSE